MTFVLTDASAAGPAEDLNRERLAVLDDLSLRMLFIDAGRVLVDTPNEPQSSSSRTLQLELVPHIDCDAVAAASLLCRVLHDTHITRVEIARDAEHVRLRFPHRQHPSGWTVDIRTRARTNAL